MDSDVLIRNRKGVISVIHLEVALNPSAYYIEMWELLPRLKRNRNKICSIYIKQRLMSSYHVQTPRGNRNPLRELSLSLLVTVEYSPKNDGIGSCVQIAASNDEYSKLQGQDF